MTVEVVDTHCRETRESCLGTLTLAFSRDPVMRWMYPEPEAYLRHFPRFAEAFGGPAFAAETAWRAHGGAGASLWFPSGVHPDGPAIEAVLRETLEPSRWDTIEVVLEQMDRFHPEEPHWYLSIIGVDAAHQGRGLGAKLLQAALTRCDEEGLIGYLESSNPANISLYERHGFRVVDEIRVGDCPPVFPMLRPAA